VRDLWVLHGVESNCAAGLYETTFGIELRIHQNNELVQSRLSRFGEAPLLLIAEQAKRELLKLGWTELPLTATPHRTTRISHSRLLCLCARTFRAELRQCRDDEATADDPTEAKIARSQAAIDAGVYESPARTG
jgi:hypothetical protein